MLLIDKAVELKQCKKCGEIKSINLFNKASHYKDGKAPECKACLSKKRRKTQDPLPCGISKLCAECNEIKDTVGFMTSKESSDGLQPKCNDCMNKRRRAKNNADSILYKSMGEQIMCGQCKITKCRAEFDPIKKSDKCKACRDLNTEVARINKENRLKRCPKCSTYKALVEFGNNTKTVDGLDTRCKVCKNKANRDYASRNTAMLSRKSAEYQRKHPEKVKARKKRYRSKKENHDKIIAYNTAYEKRKIDSDPNFRLSKALRIRINRIIKRKNGRAGSVVRDLGCSIEELRVRIESLFQPGMTWDNYGVYGWHIDHIIPLSSFDLTNRAQFLKACHFTNLQPLWAWQNLKKSDSMPVEKFDEDDKWPF